MRLTLVPVCDRRYIIRQRLISLGWPPAERLYRYFEIGSKTDRVHEVPPV
jgi:hypothetical protein